VNEKERVFVHLRVVGQGREKKTCGKRHTGKTAPIANQQGGGSCEGEERIQAERFS